MIIVFPTESCYGLGCSAFDAKSIIKVRELKKREEGKCLPVVVHDVQQWKKVAVPDDVAVALAKEFWPGPLTLVTEKKDGVPGELCGGSIACRVSPHEVVLALTAEFGPLVATSANLSGEPNPYTLDEVPLHIREDADLVIDGGKLSGEPSTVYDCRTGTLVRRGPIPLETINEKIKKR